MEIILNYTMPTTTLKFYGLMTQATRSRADGQ